MSDSTCCEYPFSLQLTLLKLRCEGSTPLLPVTTLPAVLLGMPKHTVMHCTSIAIASYFPLAAFALQQSNLMEAALVETQVAHSTAKLALTTLR